MRQRKLIGTALTIILMSAVSGYLVLSALAQPVPPGQGGQGMIYPGMMGPGMMRPGPGRPPPAASSASGAAIFQSQCAQCHALQAGAPPAAGPNLHGLFGRKAGSESGYPYSAAMRRSGVMWNAASLDRFLAAPQSLIPDTVMPYPGLPDPQRRRTLETYLEAATK